MAQRMSYEKLLMIEKYVKTHTYQYIANIIGVTDAAIQNEIARYGPRDEYTAERAEKMRIASLKIPNNARQLAKPIRLDLLQDVFNKQSNPSEIEKRIKNLEMQLDITIEQIKHIMGVINDFKN